MGGTLVLPQKPASWALALQTLHWRCEHLLHRYTLHWRARTSGSCSSQIGSNLASRLSSVSADSLLEKHKHLYNLVSRFISSSMKRWRPTLWARWGPTNVQFTSLCEIQKCKLLFCSRLWSITQKTTDCLVFMFDRMCQFWYRIFLHQLMSLLAHLNLPVDEERLNCIASSHRETFHRVVDHQQEVKLKKNYFQFAILI